MFRLAATPRFAASFAGANASPPPDQAGVVALRTDLTLSGARAANVDKEFGVDSPPAGVTVTSTMVTVTDAFTGGTLSGWDFAGRLLTVNVAASCKLIDCVIESPGWGATAAQLADVYGSAGFERCTFRGHPAHHQIAMAVRWRDGSTPLGRTARCRYLEFIADAYKPHPREFIEFCYFGCPVHAPAGTLAWNSGTTYAAGGFALDGSDNIFLSLVDSNLDNALPAAGEANASWLGLAPHSDALTFDVAEAVTFRRSLIDNAASPPETVPDATAGIVAPNGINNAWRTVRNAGTSAVYGSVSIDRVAVYRDGGASFPLQSEDGGQPNFNGPISVTNCWLSDNAAGNYVYPDGEWDVWAGNVDYTSGAPVVVATRTRAAPVNTVLPSISGTPTVGETLTGATGTWTGQPIPSLARQWLRNGAAIPGATGETYVLAGGDGGAEVSLRVTATNTEGEATATSAAVSVSTTPVFATEITLAAFTPDATGKPPVFSGRREQNSGYVFVSGSGEPGEVVQGRMVRASDGAPVSEWVEIGTTDGSDGSFEGWITGAPRGFAALRAEVGYAAAANTPALTSNSCFVGWVFALRGQSNERWAGSVNMQDTSVSPIAATPGIDARFFTFDRSSGDAAGTIADVIAYDITGDSVTDRQPVWAAMNVLAERFDDGPVVLIAHTVSGTSPLNAMNDADANLHWSDEVLIAQAAQPHLVDQTRPVPVDLVLDSYTSSGNMDTDAKALGTIPRYALGLNEDGTPVSRGATITSPFAIWDADHNLADIYLLSEMRVAFREHPVVATTAAFETVAADAEVGSYFAQTPPAPTNYFLTNGSIVSDALVDGGHASNNRFGGYTTVAEQTAAGIAYALGRYPAPPQWSYIKWPTAPGDDARYVYVGFAGRDVTTLREIFAADDPPTVFGTGAQPLGDVLGFVVNGVRTNLTTLVEYAGEVRVRIAKAADAAWTNADELEYNLATPGPIFISDPVPISEREALPRVLDFAGVPSGIARPRFTPVQDRPAANLFSNPLPAAGVSYTVLEHATFGAITAGAPANVTTITGHDGSPLIIWVATSSTSGADAGYPDAATLGGVSIHPQTIRWASSAFKLNLYHVASPGTGDLDLDVGFGANANGGTVHILRVDAGQLGSPPTVAASGGTPITTMAPGVASPQGGSTALHMIMASGPTTGVTLGGAGAWDAAAVELSGSHWTRLGVVEDVGSGSASGFSASFSPAQRVLHATTFIRPPA